MSPSRGKVLRPVSLPAASGPRVSPCGVVIFGASGDLAERKLFPSLFNLHTEGFLPAAFFAVGTGRTALTDDSFRSHVAEALKAILKSPPSPADLDEFLAHFYYQRLDYGSTEDYRGLAARIAELEARHGTGGNRLHYLSIPPSLYETVVERLGGAGLARGGGGGWSRIVIEKPFGRDAGSARVLSEKVWKVFNEDQIYRIDHYLGKETVQNILVLRFANIFFEPVWNRNFVDHVEITVAEDIGIGHRAGYYEEAGVLRDMFQNHLFQLLCITAMEAPSGFEADRVRDEKSKLLRAVRPFDPARLDETAVRGQYGRGDVAGVLQRAYLEEPGVAPRSKTETFAALKVSIDNWRWEGVPFYLRSGKRLAQRLTEIVVQFKRIPHLMFHPLHAEDLSANRLVLRIQPEEGLSLTVETKRPGPALSLGTVGMDFSYEHAFGESPEAYERLFLDAMAGDQTLFTRSDWVDLSWSLLTPVLESWRNAGAPPVYASGSWGPPDADRLLAAQGHRWRSGQ